MLTTNDVRLVMTTNPILLTVTAIVTSFE